MKILTIMFFFLATLTLAPKENNITYFECESGSMDYCTGYADGLDEASGWTMTGPQWRAAHNTCMINRGCDPYFAPPE